MPSRRASARIVLGCFAVLTLVVTCTVAADEDVPPGLLVTLKGNKEPVYAIAFSPDGKYVLTGSGEPSIKVWDAVSGRELKSFEGSRTHNGLILGVAPSPDGLRFATAAADNTARLWDFPSAQSLRNFEVSAEGRAVATSADGSRLAGGAKDGSIRIWNASDGKLLHQLSGHQGEIKFLSFHPNGQLLVSVGADSTIRYWNVSEGKLLSAFVAHASAITGVRYLSNGNVVTTGKDGSLRLWNSPTTRRVLQGKFEEEVTSLALSPDGQRLVAAAGKVVRLADVGSGATVKQFTASKAIHDVAIANGSRWIAAAEKNRLLLWDVNDGKVVMNQPIPGESITDLSFHPSGNQVATMGKDGWLRLFAIPPAPTKTIEHPKAAPIAALSRDQMHLATAGDDQILRLFRMDQLQAPIRQFTGHPGAIHALAFSGDGQWLASAGADGIVRTWKIDKGEIAGFVAGHARPITSLLWQDDRLVTTSLDGTIKTWQANAALSRQTLAHAGAVTCQMLSPDGSRLLTGSEDKQIRQWNLANGQLERTWSGPTLPVLDVAFSPRGDRVFAVAADKTLHVWESGSNKLLKRLADLPQLPRSLAVSGDGKLAIVGCADGKVRTFDVEAGKEVRAFDGHKNDVGAVLLTARGDQLLSGGDEGLVLVRPLLGGAPSQKWETGAAVRCLARSSDGSRVAVGCGKSVKVYLLNEGKIERTITTPADVFAVSFHSDGKRLLVGGADHQVRLYDGQGRLEERFTHEGAVRGVTFSQDGTKVISAGADKSVRISTPALLWQGQHQGSVRQALFSPRDQQLLSVGDDGFLRSWSIGDGKGLHSIRAHEGAARSLTLSADGNRLITIGADKRIHVWDRQRQPLSKPILSVTLSYDPIEVCLTPNGERFVVGIQKDNQECAKAFDTKTGRELAELGEDGTMPARTLIILNDNRTLLGAGNDRLVRLRDVNVVTAFEAHPGGGTGVIFHDNGTQVVTAGADKAVKLWTLASAKLDRSYAPFEVGVDSICFARGCGQIAATAGKSLRVWNTGNGNETLSLTLPGASRAVSINNDRSRIATTDDTGKVRVWNVQLKVEEQAFLHEARVSDACFHPFDAKLLVSASADKSVALQSLSSARISALGSPLVALDTITNGTRAVVATDDGKVKFVDPNNGNVDRTHDPSVKSITSLAVNRNNVWLAVGGNDSRVRLLELNSGKEVTTWTVPGAPLALTFHPNNQALLASTSDGTILAWEVIGNPGQTLPSDFGKVLQSFRHGNRAFDVALPNNGALIYSTGADQQIRTWKLASTQALRNFGHPNTVNAVAFDKTGKLLATGAGDGMVRLFDPEKGNQVRQINAHPGANNVGAIYGIAFSPDGGQLATASKDGSLKVFNVADGKLVREIKAFKEKDAPHGHQDSVLCVAFSPDGKHLASGGADRKVKVWNLADGAMFRDWSGRAGWIYDVEWLDGGKRLIAAGAAPRFAGQLTIWDVAGNKAVWSQELPIGTIYSLAISPDNQRVALATGGSVRSPRDLNLGWILKLPR